MKTHVFLGLWCISLGILSFILYAQGANPSFSIQSLTDLVQITECGNATKEYGEQCDDGNMVDTDSCTNACQLRRECPKEHLSAAPQGCRYEFNRNSDGCQESYLVCNITCGDGKINQEWEECDDGNREDNDTCSNTCKKAVCGDGMVQYHEQCDVSIAWDQCGAGFLCIDCACLKPKFCGDGQINQNTEQCDDGNANNNDGCSTLCKQCPELILPDAPLWCRYETSYNEDDCPLQRMVCAEDICSNGLEKSLFPDCMCPLWTQFIQAQESCVIDPITEWAQCRSTAKCIQDIPVFTTQSQAGDSFEEDEETIVIEAWFSAEEQQLLQRLEEDLQDILGKDISSAGKRLQLKRLLMNYSPKEWKESLVFQTIERRIKNELLLLQ
jgi:cysteine-rich repeat protein